MRKKLWRIVLVMCMFAALVPYVQAATIIDSGECGEEVANVTWTLDSDGTLTISGEGDISVSAFSNNRSIKNVVIENGVTAIGRASFSGCTNLNSIIIPDSVDSIGDSAFMDCKNLTNISIKPNSSTYRLENGILYNKEMTTLILAPRNISGEYTIPDGVDTIGSAAFDSCYKLTKINFPYKMKYIESIAFADCTGLKSLEIPFENGDYDEYQDGSGGTNYPTYIERYAFGGCTNLKTVSIIIDYSYYNDIDGYFHIRDYAFGDCVNLTKIYLPVSTILNSNTFNNCSSLRDIYYEGWRNFSGMVDMDKFQNYSIHYNFAPPTLVSERNYIISGKVSPYYSNRVNILVTSNEPAHGSQTMIIAKYDSNGTLISFDKRLIGQSDENEFTIYTDNADKIKIFIWNNEESMMPASNVFSLDL